VLEVRYRASAFFGG